MGLGLAVTGVRGGSGAPAVLDPATWGLTAWWKDFPGGTSWPGAESAGTSGDNALSEATNPPTLSSGSADFDGTNDEMTAAGTLDTYLSASAYSGWALLEIDAIASDYDTGLTYANDAIFAEHMGGYFGVHLRSAGPAVHIYHLDGSGRQVAVASISTGTLVLVQFRYDGTNIGVRVNRGSWQTTPAGDVAAGGLTTTLKMGRNYNVGYLNGRVREAGLADTAKSDDDFDNLVDYINAEHELAL